MKKMHGQAGGGAVLAVVTVISVAVIIAVMLLVTFQVQNSLSNDYTNESLGNDLNNTVVTISSRGFVPGTLVIRNQTTTLTAGTEYTINSTEDGTVYINNIANQGGDDYLYTDYTDGTMEPGQNTAYQQIKTTTNDSFTLLVIVLIVVVAAVIISIILGFATIRR